MKNIAKVCQRLVGLASVLGLFCLASCESSSEDMTLMMIVNQTSVPLAIYLDGNAEPELTVPAQASQTLVFVVGDTHRVQWQGGTIQGQVEVTATLNATHTLTVWGAGNRYSLRE